MHVGARACVRRKRALKCARVCLCALGLYHHGDNKVSGVICKLSGENVPAEALISFLLQLIASKTQKSPVSAVEKNTTVERDDNVRCLACVFHGKQAGYSSVSHR